MQLSLWRSLPQQMLSISIPQEGARGQPLASPRLCGEHQGLRPWTPAYTRTCLLILAELSVLYNFNLAPCAFFVTFDVQFDLAI